MSQFKPRDVVRYRSADTWCRHGIAVIHGGGGWLYAKDTYWGIDDADTSSYGWLQEGDLREATLIGNLDEFEPSQYKECRDFREQDQFYIPIGGGSAQTWFRKGAEPQPNLVYQRLQYELDQAEAAIQSANWKKEWAVKEINEHIAKHGIPDTQEKECVS